MASSWARFNRYLYRYWKLQTIVILLGLTVVPLSLINPYLTKLLIDKAYGNKDLKLFFILAIIGGTIFIFSGLINFLSRYLSQRIKYRVHFDITRGIFRHLQDLHISFFNERSTGEHLYKISSDISSVSDFVCDTIPQIIKLFPRFLFILIIVFYLNWKLALLALLLVPITYIQPYFFSKWLSKITSKMIEKSQDVFERLHEVFSHIYLIKILGKKKYEIKRFEENLTKRMDSELRNAKLLGISGFSATVLNRVIGGIIALYGGYQVIKGTMTLGSLTAVMIYLTQLMEIMKLIGSFYENIAIDSVSCRRLAEIQDIKPKIKDSEDAIDYPILQGRIEFKDVSFGYKKDESILKDINFSIEPTSRIAIVGPSGCGKTTLLSLILRLYEQEKGSIFIDGVDTRKMRLESLKSQIGIAPQRPLLWNDTIANNILYGAEQAASEDMFKAAQLAEAHDFIMSFPNKYDSVIGEMACKISEGQKQRIAVARALIKKAKIIILDEAMSSLDSETEDKVIDNIQSEYKGSTLVIVSHRLSTIRRMDQVYFIQDGFAVETDANSISSLSEVKCET